MMSKSLGPRSLIPKYLSNRQVLCNINITGKTEVSRGFFAREWKIPALAELGRGTLRVGGELSSLLARWVGHPP